MLYQLATSLLCSDRLSNLSCSTGRTERGCFLDWHLLGLTVSSTLIFCFLAHVKIECTWRSTPLSLQHLICNLSCIVSFQYLLRHVISPVKQMLGFHANRCAVHGRSSQVWDLTMEYGAGLRSVSDLAQDAQGCHHYLAVSFLKERRWFFKRRDHFSYLVLDQQNKICFFSCLILWMQKAFKTVTPKERMPLFFCASH